MSATTLDLGQHLDRSPGDPAAAARRRALLIARMARRRWPLLATAVMFALGLAYMFAWGPLFRAESFWATPSDVWSVFRGAHYVGWGYIGGVYTPSN